MIKILPMQVNFLTKLVALKPGKPVQEMIKNVMLGKDEGADYSDTDEEANASSTRPQGIAGRVSFTFIYILYNLLITSMAGMGDMYAKSSRL